MAEQQVYSISPTSVEERKTIINCKLWPTIEVVVLCVLITGVWSLLSLPIVFYYLPRSEVSFVFVYYASK